LASAVFRVEASYLGSEMKKVKTKSNFKMMRWLYDALAIL